MSGLDRTPRTTSSPVRAAVFILLATGLAACAEPATSPVLAPSETPSLAAGGLEVASVTTLNALPGAVYEYAEALDVNDSGMIVGTSYATVAQQHAVIWTTSTIPTGLPRILNETYSSATAVSGDGSTIVGTAYDGIAYNAVRWIRFGNSSWSLDVLDRQGASACYANDVSSDGSVIVGRCVFYGTDYAYAWRDGFPKVLGLGTAEGVNAAGQVVGKSGNGQATLWSLSGGYLNLGTLGGATSDAVAIDEKGNVAGNSETAGSASTHPFFWTDRKGMVDLDTPGTISRASDMNDNLQVVGTTNYSHATLWAKGKMVDLGWPAGAYGATASAINNLGTIVGSSYVSGATLPTVWKLR